MSRLSSYHRFCCAFVRTRTGELVSCTGPLHHTVQQNWQEFMLSSASATLIEHLPALDLIQTEKQAVVSVTELDVGLSAHSKSVIQVDAIQQDPLVVYETEERECSSGDIFGAIFQQSSAADTAFDDVFSKLLLRNIRLFTSASQDNLSPQTAVITDEIVNLFDARLRYAVDDDKWDISGRQYFHRRILEFVQRGARVEFCLPAFPCKSSSLDKVSGELPDRGEQVALENLHSFVEAIENIYEPGAKLWIVSDGHVFSDCIGVDDEVVDKYNCAIVRMSAKIGERHRGADRVGFISLIDMFDLANAPPEVRIELSLSLPRLEAHIATKRTPHAELSRQMLLQAGRSEDGLLRARIESGEHSALKLYRGFSRFMTEDLALNRHTAHLSRSKLKKLAARVSFEMIQRNEAYSNLVELFFPHHVRLSIHAHNNAGPKFGIRLLGPGVRAIEQLSPCDIDDAAEMRSVDLLHVPTPWHNCLVHVEGHPSLVMTKAKVVRDALSKGSFGGGWVEEDKQQGVAAHFSLQLPVAQPRARGKYEGELWDRQDMLDCCDPGNPYLHGREAVLEYLYASSAAVHLF